MTTDDAIRERHGVACREGPSTATSLLVWENDDYICIGGNSNTRGLTPWQAKYIAGKLNRLAARILRRQEAAS